MRRSRPPRHGSTEALPGYREPLPMVFSGSVPDRRRRLREPPRGARQAQAERRVDQLHARVVRRARVRLPLRLPRPAPHGDREGAARARVRPGADRHGAERRVPRHHDRRREAQGRQPGRSARGAEDRLRRGAVLHGLDHHAQRLHRSADGPVPDPARRDEEDGVPRRPSASNSSTRCRSPRSSSTSSIR